MSASIAEGVDALLVFELTEHDFCILSSAIAHLTRVKGIGRWSAEIYLLFALGRADVWPVDDLALAKAVIHMKGLRGKPKRAKLLAIAEPWRPWRGAAAILMWHYYHHIHDREGGAI